MGVWECGSAGLVQAGRHHVGDAVVHVSGGGGEDEYLHAGSRIRYLAVGTRAFIWIKHCYHSIAIHFKCNELFIALNGEHIGSLV